MRQRGAIAQTSYACGLAIHDDRESTTMQRPCLAKCPGRRRQQVRRRGSAAGSVVGCEQMIPWRFATHHPPISTAFTSFKPPRSRMSTIRKNRTADDEIDDDGARRPARSHTWRAPSPKNLPSMLYTRLQPHDDDDLATHTAASLSTSTSRRVP
ncbi:hypothetical protein BJ912DRAFT_1068335 [Pholiota molesta]|nr:hypothetical protein BJ912DRAFT_1068335 [Pholiota molesta]